MPTTWCEIGRELDLKDAVFVGHSVSSMIGVLAAQKAPGMFGKLVLIGPSARYIDDEGYVGGFSAKQIEELLQFLESNHMGWSAQMAPAIMGNPDRPELGRGIDQQLLSNRPRNSQGLRPGDLHLRQSQGLGRRQRSDAGPPVQ